MAAFGRTQDAYTLLTGALAEVERCEIDSEEQQSVQSRLLYETAALEAIRGDLDQALSLYRQSLAIQEQIGDIKGKAASLHQMASVYVTRGELDEALSLYRESLAIDEQIEDIKGKAASLHQMASVYVTRGDLDEALSLYRQSLAIDEQIGDIQGKAASLHHMASVYVTRGDLDEALSLYRQSLAIDEQIGDIQGKAASLSNMASVYVTRGELDEALSLYRESLAILEQIGDIQSTAASLSQMSNIYWEQDDLVKAKSLVSESVNVSRGMDGLYWTAFNVTKLGQISQRLQQIDEARTNYVEGLTLFRRLGATREIVQVEEMLASLDASAPSATDEADIEAPLANLLPKERARAEAQIEEARQALASMITRLPPGQRTAAQALLAQLSPADLAQLASMGPDDQERVIQALLQFAAMSPEEQAAMAGRARFEQVEASLLGQVDQLLAGQRDGSLGAAQAAEAPQNIESLLPQLVGDESLGEQRHELVALLDCVAALLRGEAIPPVPSGYVARWAGWG